MDYILQTKNLSKNYGKAHVLNAVNMNIPKGSIYGFVGKNGAGKTTLIRVICGLHNPTAGSYSINGAPSSSADATAFRKKMGAVVETPSICLQQNARNNLLLQYKLIGKSPDGLNDILHTVGLDNVGKKKVKNFSLGMRQRLAIAFALVNDPEFLVLDEPINGLDAQGIIEVRELLQKLNRERNVTILISSHILEELSKLATHYGFIDKGHMLREMSAEDLENASRKSTKITVNDTQILDGVLKEMGLEHKIISSSEAVIFSNFKVTPLVLALNDKNCEVVSLSENTESLESFFVELVGGNENA